MTRVRRFYCLCGATLRVRPGNKRSKYVVDRWLREHYHGEGHGPTDSRGAYRARARARARAEREGA